MNQPANPNHPNSIPTQEHFLPVEIAGQISEITQKRLDQITKRDNGTEGSKRDGMTHTIAEARKAVGLAIDSPKMPATTRSEVLDVVGDRIWRGKVDAESTVPAKAQDGGWPGYSKKTVNIKGGDGAEHEVPNNFRPSGFREKWGARRMEYAYLRYKAFNNRSMRLKKANGIDTKPDDFEKAYGIKQRHPNVKLSLLEKIRMKKVDINIALLDFRANQKMNKFNKIKTGKWWAI